MSNKSRCPKKYTLSEEEVAEIVPCSVSLVKKIRSGNRISNSYQAQTILAVDEIANKSKSTLIYNLKNL